MEKWCMPRFSHKKQEISIFSLLSHLDAFHLILMEEAKSKVKAE
jgi:hypothetical protein